MYKGTATQCQKNVNKFHHDNNIENRNLKQPNDDTKISLFKYQQLYTHYASAVTAWVLKHSVSFITFSY